MNVVSFADQLFFVTAHLDASSRVDRWFGTGFLYSVALEEGQEARFVVTNKHVLEGALSVTIRLVQADEHEGPRFGTATQITIQITPPAEPWWTGHPDPRVDVAVIPFAPILNKMNESGAAPFYRAVGEDLVPNEATIEGFDSIEEVLFIGYPAGIYDTTNFTPVARRGTSATPLSLEYCGAPAFLVDAAVHPGSSGSPVFYSSRGFRLDRASNVITLGGGKPWLLGILAATHTLQVSGDVIQLPSRYVAKFASPINLGIVYKTRVIDECVNLAIERAGAKRRVA